MNREPIDLSVFYLLSNITFHTSVLCFLFIFNVCNVIEIIPEIMVKFDMVGEALSIPRFFIKSLSFEIVEI